MKINCIRETLNWSSFELSDKFDNPRFNKDKFNEKLLVNSPKIVSLLENISKLDSKDFSKDKKIYKHYIFTDLKKSHGVKLLISSFIAAGYTFCLEKSGTKLKISNEKINSSDESKFLVLSSSSLWGNSFTPKNIRDTLSLYNERPGNVYGDKCRFIILDSGFKEGVDLFDVKYCHIFEEQLVSADMTQALGRGLRNCGQKGLPFVKKVGWKLEAFLYTDTFIIPKNLRKLKFFDEEKSIIKYIKESDKDLSFNENLISDMEQLMKKTSIDTLLTKNIHELDGSTSGVSKLKKIAAVAVPLIAGASYLAIKAFRRNKR